MDLENILGWPCIYLPELICKTNPNYLPISTTGQKTISNFTKLRQLFFSWWIKTIMYLKKNVCLKSLMGVAKKCLRGVWPNFVNLPFYLSYKPTNYLLILMNEQVLYLSRIRKKKNKKNMPPPFLQDLKCTRPNLFRESLKESTLAFSVQNS